MSDHVDMSEMAAQHHMPLGRATIGDQLRRHARTQPDHTAVISYTDDGRTETTYAELDSRANRFAQLLLANGVGRSDRVACMSRNCVDVIAAYYGALKIGAAFTGVNVMYRAGEIAHQLEHASPVIVFAGLEFAELVRSVGPTAKVFAFGAEVDELLEKCSDGEPDADVDENDIAMVIYTSGTESLPKGVMIPHRNYLISTSPAWSWGLRTSGDDTWLFVMPFHTIAGLGSMTSLTIMGATLVLPSSADPARALDIIAAERVTVMAQTPTFYLALAAQPAFGPESVGAVRRCLTYGGQVPPQVIESWSAAVPNLLWGTYWGQSELSQLGTVGWFKTLADIPDGDPTWIGKPVTHLEVRVVDADGNDAEIGELVCRTPSVMRGYFKDAERTEEVFRGGWVHTGDVVRIDKNSNLFFSDRMKDVIKTGGMNVSSQEVERVLHTHPAVLRAAVVGLPDPYWSEAVTAFVILRDGCTDGDPASMIAHCRESLAVYKIPKRVMIVDALPVDAQGKILKRELRAALAQPST